jgi:hypothetical protein
MQRPIVGHGAIRTTSENAKRVRFGWSKYQHEEKHNPNNIVIQTRQDFACVADQATVSVTQVNTDAKAVQSANDCACAIDVQAEQAEHFDDNGTTQSHPPTVSAI